MIVNRCPYCMEEMGQSTVCPNCHKDSAAAVDAAFALPHNSILHGKYLVGSVLGQGGFGITYLGFDLSLEIKVAIKEYYPRNIASRENNTVVFHSTSLNDKNQWAVGKEQFLSEARKMAKMNNIPSIVSVRETFYENDTAYIIMDYVPGITLKQFLQEKGILTYQECIQLMLPIIDGLSMAHAAGMIHRDISPDNIMLSPDGKMYLLDMGAAKDLRKKDDQAVHVVKMGFSPLEQFQGDAEIGPWSDIYSICATIYYAVYGKVVPNALDRAEKESLTFDGGRKPLTKEQIRILERGLALHKETRIKTAAELADLLRKSIDEKSRPSVNKKLAAIIAGSAAAVCIIAGTAVMAPWEPKVKEYGCSNVNVWQNSEFLKIDKQYEYFTDEEWNMYVIPYDTEDEVFYIDQATIVDDEAGSINIGKTKVYSIHDQNTEDGNQDSILQMNFDGSEPETILEQEGLAVMQYILMSNGKEYLYYTVNADEDTVYDLYRYNIASKKSTLLEENISWFNIYGKYLYYTTYDGETTYQDITLRRSFLDGSREKVLDDEHWLFNGYIVDGNIYMASVRNDVMVQVDESKRNKVEAIGGDYSGDIAEGVSVYGDGWFYYSPSGSTEIDRVMADGSGHETVATLGKTILGLNYCEYWLHAIQGNYDSYKEKYVVSGAYLVSYDGGSTLALGDSDKGEITYSIEDDIAYVTGYTGDESHISVPLTYEGHSVLFSDTFLEENTAILHLEIPEDELTYEIVDGGIRITGYNQDSLKDCNYIAIPEEIDGQPVVEIGENAFSNEDKEDDEQYTFAEMLLPDTVQLIDQFAFYGCNDLEYINIPSELKQLSNAAFAYCPLTDLEIVFPEGMKSIGAMVFANADIKSVYLPDSLEIIGDTPFAACGQSAEDGEDAEELFKIDENSTSFSVEGGVLYNAEKTIIYSTQANVADYLTIPDTVTEIRTAAFIGSDFAIVIVPSSVTDYDGAFITSDIKQVILKNGITEIPDSAFTNCDEMVSITIPDTVKSIGSEAFAQCDVLKYVTISGDCTVADDAFDDATIVAKDLGTSSGYSAQISSSDSAFTLTGTESKTITLTTDGDLPSTYTLSASRTGGCFTTTWTGDWEDNSHDITIIGTQAGTGMLTVYIMDRSNGEYIAHVEIYIEVTE